MKIKKFFNSEIIVALIIFFLLFYYVPLIKCISNIEVKKSICDDFGLCETDFWFSTSKVLFGYSYLEKSYYCPEKNISHIHIILLILFLFIVSYVLSYALNYLYKKYRDY